MANGPLMQLRVVHKDKAVRKMLGPMWTKAVKYGMEKAGHAVGLYVQGYIRNKKLTTGGTTTPSGESFPKKPTGTLRRAITYGTEPVRGGMGVRVWIGANRNVPYARIHEFGSAALGGPIKPKSGRALAIPKHGYEGIRPTGLPLGFVPKRKATKHGYMIGLLVHVFTPAFVLMSHVDVPPKRYIASAVEEQKEEIVTRFFSALWDEIANSLVRQGGKEVT